MHVRSSFAFLLVIAAAFACKKAEEKPAITEWHFDREAMKYIQLREGQYFIYKDSATGREDSVVVTKSDLHMIIFENTWFNDYQARWITETAKREVFELQMELKTNTTSTVWLWGKADMQRRAGDELRLGDQLTGINDLFRNPFVASSCWCTQMLPTMTIEGTTYRDVFVLQFHEPGLPLREYYWAPNVGLIKRVLEEGGTTFSASLLRHD